MILITLFLRRSINWNICEYGVGGGGGGGGGGGVYEGECKDVSKDQHEIEYDSKYE